MLSRFPFDFALRAIALAALAVAGLRSEAWAWQAFGGGLLVVAASEALRAVPVWRSRGGTDWALAHPGRFDIVCFGVVAAGATYTVWDAVRGRMPFTHDHPTHLTRAWHFVERGLAQGQLMGWSDIWFAGWPAGEDYGPGGDIWVAAFRLLSFGLDWPTTYAIAIAAMWITWSGAVYLFTRRYFGHLAGVVAGMAAALDRGAGNEPGWRYALEWGVWPQTLSTAFTLFALAALEQIIRRGRPADYARCAACMGFALLAHPFALVWLGIALPVRVLVDVLMRNHPERTSLRGGTALLLGLALGAWWFVPFSAKAEWFAPHGDLWLSAMELATNTWSGTLYDGVAPPLFFAAVCGGLVALQRRSPPGVWVALLALVAFTASIRDVAERIDLAAYSPTFLRLHYQRFAYIVRPCLFVLIGSLAAHLAAALRAHAARRWLVLLVAIAIAPLVPALLETYEEHYLAKMEVSSLEDVVPPGFEEFLDWARTEQDHTSNFYRVAFADDGADHTFAAFPVWTNTPQLRTNFTPATTFRFKHHSEQSDALYSALSVKFVVALQELPRPSLVLHRIFGQIRVYRFAPYSPRRFHVEGDGVVQARTFDPEGDGIRMEVQRAGGQVVFHFANYANWSATLDGEPVATESVRIAEGEGFLSVPIPRTGVLHVRYADTRANSIGKMLSVLALLLWLSLLIVPHLPFLRGLNDRLGRALTRVEKSRSLSIAMALLALSLATAKIAAVRWSDDRWLSSAVDDATVRRGLGAAGSACDPLGAGEFECNGDKDVRRRYLWRPMRNARQATDGELLSCLQVRLQPDEPLSIRFPDLTLGDRLVGHMAGELVGTPTITFRIQGEVVGTMTPVGTYWSDFELDTARWAGQETDLTLVFSAPDTASALVDARVERD